MNYYKSDVPTYGEIIEVDSFAPWMPKQVYQNQNMTVQSGNGMRGSGANPFLESNPLQTAADLLKTVEAVDTLAFGPVGTKISNTLSEAVNKNPFWRPGFAGERHIVLPTEDGLTRANFAGPGTKLNQRLERGDEGVDGPKGIDNAAKRHDIAYAKAKNYKDIRKADKVFIQDVAESSQKPAIKKAVVAAMKAKNFAEDIGLLDKETFIQDGEGMIVKGEDPNKLGKKRKLTPAEKLLKKYGKNKKK